MYKIHVHVHYGKYSELGYITSSTHSFAYSYWCFQKCFVQICETSKCHNFLIFQRIFIKFSLFCSNFLTLSSEVKLNLFRISPLNNVFNVPRVCTWIIWGVVLFCLVFHTFTRFCTFAFEMKWIELNWTLQPKSPFRKTGLTVHIDNTSLYHSQSVGISELRIRPNWLQYHLLSG